MSVRVFAAIHGPFKFPPVDIQGQMMPGLLRRISIS